MYKLKNKPQNYAWGRYAGNSLVHTFMANQDPELASNTEEPFAELWMGSHEKGESSVIITQKEEIIEGNEDKSQEVIPISEFLQTKYNKSLPYLFKILSIKDCLSIQAHPDKTLAQILHEKDPEHYPDGNHKPEMAVAITNFKAFSNFAEKEKIVENLSRYPSLRNALSPELETFANDEGVDSEKLETLFLKAESLGESIIEPIIEDIGKIEASNQNIRDELVLKLYSQFGKDIGIVVTLMLNYLELAPGECFAMDPFEPHAYFEGECFECKLYFLFVSDGS